MKVSEFFQKEKNSLRFYEDLDRKYIVDDLLWIETKTFYTWDSLDTDRIDFLTYLLLCDKVNYLELTTLKWKEIAEKMSRRYFMLIQSDSSELELKLKCQRLNYLIQIFIDGSDSVIENTKFFNSNTYYYPWDIELLGEDMCVLESKDSVKINDKTISALSGKGLMLTQIDRYGDYVLFSSCYSDKIAISYDQGQHYQIESINKDIYRFYYAGSLGRIASDGSVYLQGDILLCRVEDMQKPWRFRVVENELFIFDWSYFGSCIIVSLASGVVRRHIFDEMFIPHDVVGHSEFYCFLDKQQGNVFWYTRDLTFVTKTLSFGYSEGRLCDPIGIKSVGDKIIVSSWLSGKINLFG